MVSDLARPVANKVLAVSPFKAMQALAYVPDS
jgi:hypothetical protein